MCNLQGLLRRSSIGVLQQPFADAHSDEDNAAGSADFMSCAAAGDPSSACLWSMVNDFLEVGMTPTACSTLNGGLHSSGSTGSFLTRNGANSSDAILKRSIQEMESTIESCGQNVVEGKVASCVAKSLREKNGVSIGMEIAHNEQALPRVLQHLLMEGYDAGLCMTARKSSNALRFPPPGGHQYIDVIMDELPPSGTPTGKKLSMKFIVDVGFRTHFEIARPLPAYQKLLSMLPSIFVGKALLLQKVVRIMSQAARASLESQDMPIPPWRSFSFLLAKWTSPLCSRVTSFDEAKHIVHNTSSLAKHIEKLGVLAERDYNADSAVNRAHADDGKNGRKLSCLQEHAANAPWYPPPPTNRIPSFNTDSDDNASGYSKKRRQANVVSALALAFTESQHTQMLPDCVAASAAGKVMCIS